MWRHRGSLGRAQALADLQADATLDSVFLRFAGPYSVKTVLAKSQKEADERAGVSAVEHPGRTPPTRLSPSNGRRRRKFVSAPKLVPTLEAAYEQ